MDEFRATLLLVDDEPVNISVLMDLLKDDYRLVAARNGEQALMRAEAEPSPDLILLDVMMPGMDGHEVCRRLKANPVTRDIPVIFVTAMSDVEDETTGFRLGAVDYILKPISPPIVEARIANHLTLRQAQQALSQQNRLLEERVAERTRDLAVTQDVTILSMASLAETRDNETGNHIRRTQHYVRVLARYLQQQGEHYSEILDERTIDLLFKSAPLHDIGKVGIPDAILLKPGRLDSEEFEIMKSHTTLGRDAILTAERALQESIPASGENTFLHYAREIAYSHQEKWDGSGYPEGLAGEEIPLSARLMAVADVYDALISKRVYKPPFSHEKACQIIREGRGTHFEPLLVDAFIAIEDQFLEVSRSFSDG
ncbi:MAG: two-component system response regulator [Gammaproteobacteria bacterium]|nr:two-component system response regulator [Gammaproteobacteria bacterium]